MVYNALDERHRVYPIIISTRLLDESEDIGTLQRMIYTLYDEQGIICMRPGQLH